MATSLGTLTLSLIAQIGGFTPAVDKAQQSVNGIAAASKSASKQIDDYVKKLELQVKTNGMSEKQATLYKLALKGASDQQLQAAKTALELNEAYAQGVKIGERLKTAFAAASVAALGFGVAGVAKFREIVDGLDALNDVQDATGATVESISALEDVAVRTGTTLENVSSILVKFNNGLKEADGKNAVSQALKAIGVDADALKKLDPAEALRQTAVALSNFADDGDKARAIQVLFGKSVKEASPFLHDLAEQGTLNAKVTKQQSDEAEALNKQFYAMQKNFIDSARAITGEFIPALTQLAKAYNEGGISGLLKQLSVESGGYHYARMDELITKLGEITELEKKLKALQAGGYVRENIGGIFLNQDQAVKDYEKRIAIAKGEYETALAAYNKSNSNVRAVKPGDVLDDEARRRLGRGTAEKPSIGGIPDDPTGANKAQLALDIDRIRKASEAITNIYSNSEKLLEATRAAGLLNEKEYYDTRLSNLKALAAYQEAALEDEVARLKKENGTFSGKDAAQKRAENQKAIDEAQAKIIKVRQDAATATVTLGIQEKTALEKTAQAYRDLQYAADDYLSSLQKASSLSIASFTMGDSAAQIFQQRAQAQDKYEQQRRDLLRKRTDNEGRGLSYDPGTDLREDYDKRLAIINDSQAKELAIINDTFEKRKAIEGDYYAGALKGLHNYSEEVGNVAKQVQDAFTSAFRGLEDALVNFVTTGKLDFKSLADSIIADLARIQIKKQITGPLSDWLGGLFTGTGGVSLFGGGASNWGSGSNFGNMDLGLNFDGGGYTGDGARSGGLDGKGGFMALLHPQETVIDHTRGQGSRPSINIGNVGSGVSRSEVFAAAAAAVAVSQRQSYENRR